MSSSTFQQYNVYDGLTACRVVSTGNVAGTYFNGTVNNGVGATLTIAASSLTVDSVVLVVSNRVLLVGQSLANQNGIYVVSSIGATVVLTRAHDMKSMEQIRTGQFVTIGAGTVNAGATYVIVEPLPAQFGISNFEWNAAITSGLGTAATKAASANAQPTVASVSGATTTGNIVESADTAGTVADGPVAANKVLTSAIVTPDVGANLITFDVTVGEAALATGGAVTLQASSGSKQYKIRSLELESGGTNFSGGGGDRLGQVTDGTTVYSVVPAATMQALTNARWSQTALPNAASAANNTSTAAGAALTFKYSGGTTDYTAGSLRISGIMERIA